MEMVKIFYYELRRLLGNRFTVGLLLVALLYGYWTMRGEILLGIANTAPFSPWSFGAYLAEMMPLLLVALLCFLSILTSDTGKRVEVLIAATPLSQAVHCRIRLKQIYSLLSEKAKETAPGKLLEARIADLEKVGIAATAPDFTLTTPEGKQVSLYSVKGKLKIIDFWASWCGPCRMENPNMVKLYNDFKDKGLAIVSVSLDERKVPWVQAIKKDGMPWTHVSSLKGWKCEVVKQYNIDAVPSIIVLDENNRILAKNIRAEKLRAFVTEYLK